ncbi:OmpA family protein [Flavobacterium sp. DG1-102-2]|uniref:OmpA family protein n=1 Tax=Flavobacterium sp. DG1-102-2 TaxID=3081663 RepID=UPI00294A86B1|nr:OmpA family protein [Flavobacterium sp. DG1-102-2]MDV6170075.1 OmpA family protein [Flavobacterium sp. DG1-102-2]
MKPIVQLLLLLSLSANAQHKFTVYFDFDIDETNAPSTQSLTKWIADNPLARIQKIYGYADKTGGLLYNQDLSERRALYVFGQLKAADLYVEQVEEKGFGESQSTAIRNPKDRKVVIEYARPEVQPAPAPVPVPAGPSEFKKQVTNAKKGDKIRIKGMNFYNNMDVMLPSSLPALDDLLQVLKDMPTLRIDIQGHVCCEPEKQNISLKRAVVVYNYLIKNGIDKERLSYKGFGTSNPIYPIPEKNEDQKIANRRVEIEIVDK